MAELHQIFCALPAAVAWSSSDGIEICYLCTSGFKDDILFSHNGHMMHYVVIEHDTYMGNS